MNEAVIDRVEDVRSGILRHVARGAGPEHQDGMLIFRMRADHYSWAPAFGSGPKASTGQWNRALIGTDESIPSKAYTHLCARIE